MVLTLLFAAVSIALTALTIISGASAWWLLPLFIGFFATVTLVYVLLLFSAILLLPKGNPSPRTRRIYHRFVRLTVRLVMVLLGMRVRVTGAQRLPHAPYLLVGNHRSAFDPLCTVAVLNTDTVFVAKPGVMRIPLIGALMDRLCFLAIDRDNPRNAVTTIKRAAELIGDVGLCVGIYPEGTRSKDGTLLPFHAGSFKIAKLANCPVAVAAIHYEKAAPFPWCKRVHVRIVDVMDASFVAESNTATMTERAETALREELGL